MLQKVRINVISIRSYNRFTVQLRTKNKIGLPVPHPLPTLYPLMAITHVIVIYTWITCRS